MALCVDLVLEEAMDLSWDRLVECNVLEIQNGRVRAGIM